MEGALTNTDYKAMLKGMCEIRYLEVHMLLINRYFFFLCVNNDIVCLQTDTALCIECIDYIQSTIFLKGLI